MSGFNEASEGDFDRLFFTDDELFTQFVGSMLFACGYNNAGRLGDGTTTNRSSLVMVVGGGTNWKQVACGSHTAAIKTDGTLWTWGAGFAGSLGNDTTTNGSSPGTTAGGGTNWRQVACGSSNTAAIKTDGTLWVCGYNQFGKLGDGTTTSRLSLVTTAGGGTNWKQVSCGRSHTAAIKTDGTLWTWGRDHYGQLGIGVQTSRSSPGTTVGGGTNWRQVSAGGRHTAAVKTDGTLWTWGTNLEGQLGEVAGNRSSPATTAGGGTTWKQVACGYNHTAAVKTDGTLWTWGQGQFGRIGDGTVTNRSSPVTTAGGGTNWKQVTGGTLHTAAIKTDGTLWTWGHNQYGNLGDGTVTNRSSPVITVGERIDWRQVACGDGHTASTQYN